MGFIFDFLGNIFGYVLWFFFDAVSNYAVAITLFAIFINLLMLPISIKRQKNMALNARINAKDQELRKKYEKNPRKYNEERALLYEKEGIDPMAGCFSTMILPLLLWSGIFGAITKPLQNTLHIAQEKVSQAVAVLPNVPELEGKIGSGYEQLQLVRHFEAVKNYLTMFNADEFADVEEYSHGFNFFGINLLNIPNVSSFNEMLWVIPLLCLLGSILAIYVNQKMMGTQTQMQGCTKFLPYGTAIFTTYLAYTIPGAVGLYWFINGLIGVLQNIWLNKYYNIYTINAQSEAARIALLEIKEASVTCIKDPKDVELISGQSKISSKSK